LSHDATTPQNLLAQGIQLLQSGQNKAALLLFEQVLAKSPDHCDALNFAGVAAWQAGGLDKALGYLDQAMARHPEHSRAYLNVGVILEHHGRLEDAVNAYRASLQADPNQPLAYLNLGNAVKSLGRNAEALEAFEKALRLEPQHLDALNNKAMVLKELGRMDDALAVLRQVVSLAPDAEQGWTNLGLVLRLSDKPEEALEAYERALTLSPASIKTLNNMAVLHRWQGRLEEAKMICQGILSNHPDVIEVQNNLGDILQAQGCVEDARVAFEQVLRLDPSHPEGHHNLAVLLLLCGDFENGWREYEWRWLAKEFPSERRNFTQPLWTGEDLNGQTVLLYVEQGLGDALQFVRYAPLVKNKGGRVIVECPKTLARLFETVEGIDQVVTRGEGLPDFDLQCPFLSLPGLLSPTQESIPAEIPYFHLNDQLRQPWRNILAECEGLKVGLVWAGSPHHTNDRERSIRLEALSPLFGVSGCCFINLQIGDSAQQMAEVNLPIIDKTSEIDDYADTAALVSALDLVISVDTSVAHVAGALGKPVWVLLPHAPDWRWMLERDDSPWYPTMKLFRQPKRGAWDSVIFRVKAELETLKG